jgi:exo-beta-1,3-glucanase (GH17 family)
MQVYLGNYPIPDDNGPYERQRDTIKEALQAYGADHVAGVTVGNEFMLKYVRMWHHIHHLAYVLA